MPSGTIVKELLDKGLVTKRHAAMLNEGELQQADDVVYRQFDPAVHAAPGRTEFISTALATTPYKALSHISFDQGSDLLLAYKETSLLSAPVTGLTASSWTTVPGLIGTLSNATGGPETMHTIYYGNAYYLFFSNDLPQKIVRVIAPLVVVANCTVAVDTFTLTTTTVKGFANVQVGQAVTGTGIVASAIVASKNSSTSLVLSPVGSTAGAVTGSVTFAAANIDRVESVGLLPVDRFLPAQVSATTGVWNTTLGTGIYWFLVTEMYKPGELDDTTSGFMESGFTGSIQYVQITDVTTQGVAVAYGSAPYLFVNSVANGVFAATHWQVYMSDRTATIQDRPSLVTFKRVGAPIPVSQTSVTLSNDATLIGPKNPTTNGAFGAKPAFSSGSGAYTAHDGTVATSTDSTAAIRLGSFGLTGSGTVRGMQIKIYGTTLKGGFPKPMVPSRIQITPRKVASTLIGNSVQIGLPFFTFSLQGGGKITNTTKEVVLGGEFDLWDYSSTIGDYADGVFELLIERTGSDPTFTNDISIDGVEITLFTGGTTVNYDGISFRTVTYRSQVGTTVSDTANLPAPVAFTGDVFQGSVVTNTREVPNAIRWSLPGIGTSWPKPYQMVFQSRRKDEITNIRTLGQILVVGMRDSIKRVNYLPSELDTDFQNGLAHEDLAVDHGITGPNASVLVDIPNVGTALVYVSYHGIRITDGITTRFLNIDLDWENTVHVSSLGSCILRNYPKENWLIFFYAPSGTTHGKNTRALIFPYSPDHIKDAGMLPAIGPIKVSARSAETVSISGKTYIFTGHQATGKVYVEDQAYALPTGYTVANAAGTEAAIVLSPTVKTRRVYANDIGGQAREQRIYLLTDPFGSSITAVGNTTADSASVGSSAAFGSVTQGMLVTGAGIQPDTIVITAGASTIVLSKTATATATGTTLTFSTGTLGITVGGQDINTAVAELQTGYQSTQVGGLLVTHLDNLKESFELKISKVTLPDTTQVALGVGMRLHAFAYMVTGSGQETHRG